jgi:hypothetical protein
VAEVADSLEAWLRREPISWTKPSLVRRSRLWVRRKPALAVAAGLVVIVLLASGTALQQLAAVAREERFESSMAEAKLEQEEEYRQKFRANLRKIKDGLREAADEGLAHEVLPRIWLSEWLFGPTVLGDGPELFDLWSLRLDVVRDLLAKARARGTEDYLEAMQWESALAFWLLNDWYDSEAEPLVADNYARWEAVLDPQDPWLVYLRAMHACARVGRYAGCDLDGGPPSASPQELADVTTTLEQAEGLLRTHHFGTPLHHLVLVHQEMLYGSDLLDRPWRLAEVKKTLAIVTE